MMLIQELVLTALSVAVIGQINHSPDTRPGFSDHADDRQVVEVINLEQADTMGICTLLRNLKLGLRCDSPGDHQLVVSGLQEDVAYVLNEVIPKLQAPGDTGVAVRSIRLSKYPPEGIVRLLQELATSRSARVAVDEFNRTVIVQGNDEDLALVQQLVEWVDQPTEALTLNFYFIRASVGGGAGAVASDLPENLRPIMGTMTANGFGAMSLLATVMIHTDEGSRFEQTSSLRSGSDEEAEEMEIRVGGEARLDANGSAVQLEVEAAMLGDRVADKRRRRNTAFNVETAVALKLNGYAILAAGPGSTADGNALAIVVHVTKN